MASELRVDRIIPVNGVPTGGGGGIVQVVQQVLGTTTATSNNSWVATGLSQSITPLSSTNKILAKVEVSFSGPQNAYIQFQLRRDSTNILVPTETGTGSEISGGGLIISGSGINSEYGVLRETFSKLDSPATTSSVTYDVIFRYSNNTSSTAYINRGFSLGDDNQFRTVSTLTLMEVSG